MYQRVNRCRYMVPVLPKARLNFKLHGSTSEAVQAVLQDAWMKLGPVSFNLVGSAFATTWLKLRLSIFSLSETKRLQMFYLAMPLSFIVSFVVVVMFLKKP